MNDVTVVFTSCGRQDLLDISLQSFFMFNSYPDVDVIVVEDGPAKLNKRLEKKYANRSINWLSTGLRIGQIGAIDLAYSQVKTPYIFHTEDDWKFHAPGFIERSLDILRMCPDCLLVRVQPLAELRNHPVVPAEEIVNGVLCKRLQLDFEEVVDDQRYVWHGFAFNPGLRRLVDYQRVAPFTKHVGTRAGIAGRSEEALGKLFRSMGFYAVILTANGGCGYVSHIGKGRTVNDSFLVRAKRRIKRILGRSS